MMKRKTAFLICCRAELEPETLALSALRASLVFIYNTSNAALFIGYRSSGSELHCVLSFF